MKNAMLARNMSQLSGIDLIFLEIYC